MPAGIRRPDPLAVRSAVGGQWQALRTHAAALDAAALRRPSSLPGWTVNELITHIADGIEAVTERLDRPRPAKAEVTIADWARACAARASELADTARQLAADTDGSAQLERAVTRAQAALARVEDLQQPVWSLLGGFRLADYLVTRVVEAVVHADDLDPSFPHDRTALGVATRALTHVLAVTAPGSSVELRVPPYAAAQCVPGPRHTRGTPPNEVQTDPLTWLRLATGRLSWADAIESGRLRASGRRADLSPYLPLLA